MQSQARLAGYGLCTLVAGLEAVVDTVDDINPALLIIIRNTIWEYWYIPHYGKCRIYILSRTSASPTSRFGATDKRFRTRVMCLCFNFGGCDCAQSNISDFVMLTSTFPLERIVDCRFDLCKTSVVSIQQKQCPRML